MKENRFFNKFVKNQFVRMIFLFDTTKISIFSEKSKAGTRRFSA